MACLIINADCMEAMRELIEKGEQVDSIVTDPPYELGFMGKDWDKSGIAYDLKMWQLCFQLLRPGGHLLSFGGSRTYHRMACAIEDAGFEIRDQIMWVYGQGFPKSLDISKAIDKMAGAEREVIGARQWSSSKMDAGNGVSGLRQAGSFAGDYQGTRINVPITAPETEAAKQWQGFGTALKPAHEPIVLARKPLSEKTIAENVLKHGTGAINIDGCRVETQDNLSGGAYSGENRASKDGNILKIVGDVGEYNQPTGRFPANLIHDGSDEVEEEFVKYGEKKSGGGNKNTGNRKGLYGVLGKGNGDGIGGDTGTASRFFYCAKASKLDRNGSKHPTVKPIALMRYLCRLITPPNGVVLDPFAGSGTTGQAALEEGFKAILIEKEKDYIDDINRRIEGT